MNTNLTNEQKDYAIYLPAISSFYSTYIGKQQAEEYVPQSRMPQGIPDMEMLNFFNPQKGLFEYKWGLYSAGHANLDLNKDVPAEYMIRNRGNHTTLLADSGGFQIAKGVWEADWKNMDAKAQKYRSTVLKWLCQVSDYSMTLDIPTWIVHNPESVAKTNIHTVDDAIAVTKANHEYFMENSFGDAKFLNVLQGSNHQDADEWYEIMKEYNDPKKHKNYFRGWSMGGANMADPHLALKRIVTIIHDGLLEPGKHDWMHFLGTSKLEWGALLTSIQRAVRKYHNPNFTISFDSASPFLATANGQLYTHTVTPQHGKWKFHMEPTVDNKAYAHDTRSFKDVVTSELHHRTGKIIHPDFADSPISANMQIKDICVYAPGDLNKIGKEGKTSWDSFSYALMMGHNVWHHINSVQQANREYDNGVVPDMLFNNFDGTTATDIIEAVFMEPDYDNRLAILDHYSKFWMGVAGARGMGGKKAVQAHGQFNALFDVVEVDEPEEQSVELDEHCLEELEERV